MNRLNTFIHAQVNMKIVGGFNILPISQKYTILKRLPITVIGFLGKRIIS